MSIIDKLNHLLSTKEAIRKAIISKGVPIPTSTKFSDYPRYISLITTSEGSNEITPNISEFNIKTKVELGFDIKKPYSISFQVDDSVEIKNDINIKLQGGSD